MKSFSARLVSFASLLALSAAASPASARRTGMNLPCHNCHEGRSHPEISVGLSATRVEPGQPVTITVTAKHAVAKVGGVLVDSRMQGAFELIDPVGTHLFESSMTQVTHAMPHAYQNGQLQWSFKWNAPAMSGAFMFDAWTNAGNDNMMPTDDSAEGIVFGVGVGCDGAWYYNDGDQDGEGAEVDKVFSCTPVAGRIAKGGDCADDDPKVNSAAVEVCNLTDDNCNGVIDDGFTPMLLVTDADGDGHGTPTGQTLFGCPPVPGFAVSLDDCNDADPSVNPKATEVANGRDDDCNGKVDDVAMMPAPTPTQVPTAPPAAPTNGSTADSGGCSLASAGGAPSGAQGWAGSLAVLAAVFARGSRRLRRSKARQAD